MGDLGIVGADLNRRGFLEKAAAGAVCVVGSGLALAATPKLARADGLPHEGSTLAGFDVACPTGREGCTMVNFSYCPAADEIDYPFTLSLRCGHQPKIGRLIFALDPTMYNSLDSNERGTIDSWPVFEVSESYESLDDLVGSSIWVGYGFSLEGSGESTVGYTVSYKVEEELPLLYSLVIVLDAASLEVVHWASFSTWCGEELFEASSFPSPQRNLLFIAVGYAPMSSERFYTHPVCFVGEMEYEQTSR